MSAAKADNNVTIFQLDNSPVRGRAVHLGDALNAALCKPDGSDRYPAEISRMLGEAMMIGALVARALKFKGRLIVQCYGTNEGAISLLMADCTTDGIIRGYARYDEEQLKMIRLDNRRPGAKDLLGDGTFSMTIDQGSEMDQYQGLAAIEGNSLAECAEHYFRQSEQIPTRMKLACGQAQMPGQDPCWRGGGMMIQKIADDETRGSTDDDWDTAKALFETLADDELIDPDVPQETLLYRLFHESGVRVVDKGEVSADCPCSHERLKNTLKSFDKPALTDMAEEGSIIANCQFCDMEYRFELGELLAST